MTEDDENFLIQIKLQGVNFYVMVENVTEKMFVDVGALPLSAFLCAGHDGVDMFSVVPEHETEPHDFLPMEWVINDWGGYPDLIEAIKGQRDRIIKELPKIREHLKKSDSFKMEI